MTDKKPEFREGSIGTLHTEAGEVVFLPAVPSEDFSKLERVKGETDYFKIDDQTIGFISEALKQKDLIHGHDFKEVFLRCFLRGAKKEFGLEFYRSQLETAYHTLPQVEQIRRSSEVIFLVKLVAMVVLTDQQLTDLDMMVGKIEVVKPAQLQQFIKENEHRIRPAARVAGNKLVELQQQ